MAKQSGLSKYCLDCRYCLDHLENNACPECGRAFDPSNPRTFGNTPRIWGWPRWETAIALFLLGHLYFLTWQWSITGPGRFAKYRSMSPEPPFAFFVEDAISYLVWFSPSVCLIPLFIVSGLRVRPRNRTTAIASTLALVIYLICDGTWIWFGRIPHLLKEIYSHESYFESIIYIFS